MEQWHLIVVLIIILMFLYWQYDKLLKPRVLYFYKPDCEGCKKFSSTWDILTREISMNPRMIDCSQENSEKIKKIYGINSVPTIVKIKDDIWERYDGDMTFEGVSGFIQK